MTGTKHCLTSPYHLHSIGLTSPYHPHSIGLTSPYHPHSIGLTSPYHPHSIGLTSPYHPHSIGLTSLYHPHSIGLTERFNQALQTALLKVVNNTQNDWNDHLSAILFAYRIARQNATRISPFEVMYCWYVLIVQPESVSIMVPSP